jgi:hypothetical protein
LLLTDLTIRVPAVACKKATGRFIMATINDPAMVTIGSVILSLAEVGAMMTVSMRDRMAYRCIFGSRSSEVSDPLALLKHKRNKKLRIQLANLETSSHERR